MTTRFEAFVLRRVAALTRGVNDEQHLALVAAERGVVFRQRRKLEIEKSRARGGSE